jgi:isoquinoline 1-oxidoreductase subunit alpha
MRLLHNREIMCAVGLLNRESAPDDDEIRRAMDGNVCRCGTYSRILAAVKRAANTLSTEASRG